MPMSRGVLLIALIGLIACNSGEKPMNKKAVAQADGKTLYIDEIQFEYNSRDKELLDSALFFKTYIERWIKQQLLVSYAEKNLSRAELNVKKELENYRQELVINKFKEKKIENQSELKVSDAEVATYYQQNKAKFILNYPIVKVGYAVFPANTVFPRNFKTQITSFIESERSEAEEFVFQNSLKYDDFDNSWVFFDNLVQNSDVAIAQPSTFLEQNKTLEFKQNGNIHFVAIKAVMQAGEFAPLEFVTPQIRATLLNKKKLDFLREFKDSLYQDGLKYNKFSVFNK
jgi:hypothetical protein